MLLFQGVTIKKLMHHQGVLSLAACMPQGHTPKQNMPRVWQELIRSQPHVIEQLTNKIRHRKVETTRKILLKEVDLGVGEGARPLIRVRNSKMNSLEYPTLGTEFV